MTDHVPSPTGTLVLMGSGETTPTMVTVHQQVLAATGRRLGRDHVRAALLDTPYGFQENAADLTARARHYFAHHVGQAVDHIDAAVLDGASPVAVERALSAVRQSDWIFAGPGSPTYAARQWLAAPFTDALEAVHRQGGAVVLASAAAVTAGARTIPVYEIYKAGEPPGWHDGLGLVARLTGWDCVVVPHFDNAEGGTHDTRFCYMGERRLRVMESQLAEGTWVLGIDEHTACVIDGASDEVRVHGRGAVHVRHGGEVLLVVPAGSSVAIGDLVPGASPSGLPMPTTSSSGSTAVDRNDASVPLEQQVIAIRESFDDAIQSWDADAAIASALEMEQVVRAWAADTEQGGPVDAAIAGLRAMITRLGEIAGAGMHDHTELVRPHIETLLHVREDARMRKVFEVADHIRGHMDADGVRVEDTREGTRWEWEDPLPLPQRRDQA